ncbi:MAG: baseplate J/gp47 family protein [Deltaproteobacteria bacterium]|nr:baseplate J/gp47 family protein [Deltaproteobacteria bacterium]
MSIPISKTLDQVRQDLFDKISSVQQEGWLPSKLNLNKGIVRGMIELWAWGLFQLYAFLATLLKQAFPSTATGPWLVLHCDGVGVKKLLKTKAKGNVRFYRTGSTGNVNIDAGSVVKTPVDALGKVYRFVTLADAVLLDGTTEIYVEVEAEEYGSGSNVTVNQITEIVTSLPGVDGVDNAADWLTSEGADAEEDEPLRERYYLSWKDINGSTKYAYESWGRSVTGVASVTIVDQHPRGQGTVDVVIVGTAGAPTPTLIAAVQAVIDNNKPINDDALVIGPTEIPLDITVELELVSGDESTIISEVDGRIRMLFDYSSMGNEITPLDIGDDLPLDRITVCGMIDGVKKVNITAPVADTSIAANEVATLNSLTVTAVWATEE